MKAVMNGSRSRLAAGLLMGACLTDGCDYFRPTQPEPPSSEATFIPNYSAPDSTLATIAVAIEIKGHGNGIPAYNGAFADSLHGVDPVDYHQFFWPQDVVDWSLLSGHPAPADWGIVQESAFYTRFVQIRSDKYEMKWAPDPPNPDDIGSETATIHRHYVVTAHAVDGTQNGYLAFGYADLRLMRFSDGNWRIVKWDDRRDPTADAGVGQITFGRQRLNNTQ